MHPAWQFLPLLLVPILPILHQQYRLFVSAAFGNFSLAWKRVHPSSASPMRIAGSLKRDLDVRSRCWSDAWARDHKARPTFKDLVGELSVLSELALAGVPLDLSRFGRGNARAHCRSIFPPEQVAVQLDHAAGVTFLQQCNHPNLHHTAGSCSMHTLTRQYAALSSEDRASLCTVLPLPWP